MQPRTRTAGGSATVVTRVERVLALIGAASMLAVSGVAVAGGDRTRDPPARAARAIRLAPTPASVIDECRRLQAQAGFRMLCPRVLPRPLIGWPPGQPPSPLAADSFRSGDGIDIGYGAGWEDPKSPHAWRNRPCCFLHFVVQRGRPAPGGRAAVLGGRRGKLLPASSSSYWGPYFGNHHRFFFRERGVPFVVTLHDFGRRATTALLGRLIAQLRPVAALRAPSVPPRARVARFDDVGARAIAAAPGALWILTREKPVDPGKATAYSRARLLRLDPLSGRIEARIRIAGYMRGLTIAAGSVWVAAARPLSGTRSEGIVVRVEPTSRRVTAVIRTGTWPSALAAADGGIWVVNAAPFFKRGTLVRIATATNRLDRAPIPLGPAPSGLAVGAGSVWVADTIEGTVRRIDTARRRIVARIRVGNQPYALAFLAGSLWVTNADSGTVSRIDPGTNRVAATIRVGRNPYGITAGPRSLWVTNLGDGTVAEIDAASGSVRRTLSTGGDPVGVAVSDGSVWVTQNSEGRALRVPGSR